MGSSRFPGKVLADVGGRAALDHLLDRLRACQRLDDIVLATTTDARDEALETWAARVGVACFRGSEDDVLARVVGAQRLVGGEVVVEVTGDCTLLCPEIIDLGVDTFFANRCDVVSNCGAVQTFPMGADVQVFPLALLEEVERTITDPAVREHVSLHFYRHPERYRIHYLLAPAPWREPSWRLQLDYPEDLVFINAVYAALVPDHGPVFGLAEIVGLLRRRPELLAINAHCQETVVQ